MAKTLAGKVCVSVIEARNVLADEYAELNFYVKLRVGPNEVRTDIIKGSSQPKFLKDCRLVVPSPETDYLKIELLQQGPRGDLVVGSDELRIITITAKGTIVHWFELKAAGSKTAELCLVLRYLSAGANRPMSPTYAIAARQAKERALDSTADPQRLNPSRALFTDELAMLPPAAKAAEARAAASGTESTSTSGAGEAATGTTAAGAAGAGAGAGAAGPKAASSSGAKAKAGGGSSRGGKGRKNTQVPLPLAILSGVLVGALVYIWKKRPVYYEVQEDDTLCHIASCFKKKVNNLYTRNQDLLKTPDTIYPGDRIRIQ